MKKMTFLLVHGCALSLALAWTTGCATDASGPDGASDETARGSGSEQLERASEVIADATAADCPVGDICFYTGANLTGSLCHWGIDDPDWAGGSIRCSWATTKNVCSVWNRSFGNVEYFRSANYASRIGSTNPSVAGNLACTYMLRSHRCSSGGCF